MARSLQSRMAGWVAGSGDVAGNRSGPRSQNTAPETRARIPVKGKERVGFLFSAAIPDAHKKALRLRRRAFKELKARKLECPAR
jgi:hypothetical protein